MSGSELGPWPPSVTGFFEEILPGLHRRGVPGDAEADVVGDAAEPGELGAVEGRAAFQQRIDAGGAREGAERGAVLRRRRVDEVRRAQAAGAGHVLRHDRRVARDVLADVAGEMAGVEVVAAADREADREIDGLALVELLDALGARRSNGHAERAKESSRAKQADGIFHDRISDWNINGRWPLWLWQGWPPAWCKARRACRRASCR